MRKYLQLLLPTLFLTTAIAYADTAPTGPGYTLLSTAQPTNSGTKVEVVEVFSYGCIHCAQFQPYVDGWRKKLDQSAVQFTYLPAPFNPMYKMLARGFYAAESLGIVESTHQRVFNALFIDGKRVNTLDDLVNLYASLGANRDKFRQAAQSFYVETQLRRAEDLMRGYQIEGTPTLIVAGKYRVASEGTGGNERMLAVVDQLIAKERQAKAPVKAATPTSTQKKVPAVPTNTTAK